MITVIALTQFAFLTLAIVLLNILNRADTATGVSRSLGNLNTASLWLFLVPVVWIGFASVCAHFNRGVLLPSVANALGILVAVACFLFLAFVTFFPAF
jgi:hypothetical protein